MHSITICAILAVSLASCAGNFVADVSVASNGMLGEVTGVMYYQQNVSVRIDYTLGTVGLMDLSNNYIYTVCSDNATYSCNGGLMFGTPVLFKLPSDVKVGPSTCGSVAYDRNATQPSDVKHIAFLANGKICKAVLNDGTEWKFSNVKQVSSIPTNLTTVLPEWNCNKVCQPQADIVFVMDESGSIDASEFSLYTFFTGSVVDSLGISEDEIHVGVVKYSSFAREVLALSSDPVSIRNYVTSRTFPGGATATAVAMMTGRLTLTGDRGRAGVQKIMLVLTDGYCTCVSADITTQKNLNEQAGILTIAVGIDSARYSELREIASGTGGTDVVDGKTITTAIRYDTFAQLQFGAIVRQICTAASGSSCSSSCNGFCTCKGDCLCPDTCPTDRCQVGSCTEDANGDGCTYKATDCNDNDACTEDWCNSTTGCQHQNITCPDTPCYTKSCDRGVGCVYQRIDCNDNDPCTSESCNISTGACQYTSVACDLCQIQGLNASSCSAGKSLCQNWNCEQNATTASCKLLSENDCDDLNKCTNDHCNSTSGKCEHADLNCNDHNACTIDSCDQAQGCVNLPVNATEFCDDHSVCTIDTCDETVGCVYTPVICNYTTPCRQSTCDSILGCIPVFIPCNQNVPSSKKTGCYAVICNEDVNSSLPLGCQVEQVEGGVVDKCGVCNGDGSSCKGPVLTVAEAAGLGAGIIAAIAIGAVAAFCIVTGVAGRRAYNKYYKPSYNFAESNTMYEDPGLKGNNPFYSDKTAIYEMDAKEAKS